MILAWFRKHLHLDHGDHEIDVDLLDQSLDMIKLSANEVCKEAVNAVKVIEKLKTPRWVQNSDVED